MHKKMKSESENNLKDHRSFTKLKIIRKLTWTKILTKKKIELKKPTKTETSKHLIFILR